MLFRMVLWLLVTYFVGLFIRCFGLVLKRNFCFDNNAGAFGVFPFIRCVHRLIVWFLYMWWHLFKCECVRARKSRQQWKIENVFVNTGSLSMGVAADDATTCPVLEINRVLDGRETQDISVAFARDRDGAGLYVHAATITASHPIFLVARLMAPDRKLSPFVKNTLCDSCLWREMENHLFLSCFISVYTRIKIECGTVPLLASDYLPRNFIKSSKNILWIPSKSTVENQMFEGMENSFHNPTVRIFIFRNFTFTLLRNLIEPDFRGIFAGFYKPTATVKITRRPCPRAQ